MTVTLSGHLTVCPECLHGSMHRRVQQVAAEERLTNTPSDLVSEPVREGAREAEVDFFKVSLINFSSSISGMKYLKDFFIVLRSVCISLSGIQIYM